MTVDLEKGDSVRIKGALCQSFGDSKTVCVMAEDGRHLVVSKSAIEAAGGQS
jgi:hypothetical protein